MPLQDDVVCRGESGCRRFYFSDQADEKLRDAGFKEHPSAVDRMGEGDRSGMQCQSAVGIVSPAVFFVPHDRMPLLRQMHPDLVFAAGQQMNVQQAESFGLFQDGVLGMGQFSQQSDQVWNRR